jgi:hypothetical protein
MAENNMDEVMVEKALKGLKASYDMYETTKKETKNKMKDALNPDGTKKYSNDDIKNQITLIENAQEDVVSQYTALGGNLEDLKKETKSNIRKITDFSSPSVVSKAVMEKMAEDIGTSKKKEIDDAISSAAKTMEKSYIPSKGDYDPTEQFDVIPLPSKGEGYKDKIAKMSVAFLTAYDENMIVSPNLYKDNHILDYILQEKVLSKEIDPLDLLEGDRDAIILFLRASGYGNEYPITATDEATGKEFDTVVDLSKLEYKDFRLKGDSNGWFSFTLPVSKKEVKFRFPTHRDTLTLEQMNKFEELNTRKKTISDYVSTLDTFVEADKDTSKEDKIKVRQAIRTIESWGDKMDEDNAMLFTHNLTNRLNLLIMAVDGITDRDYISNFIKRMNVRDSSALRKYMTANEPGIDYNIEVERPESLGGGSFKTFLQLDQFLFLNIAD